MIPYRLVRALLTLVLAAAVFGGCGSEPQIPGGGRHYAVRTFDDRYALTVDPAGNPLEIWDLAYPSAERDESDEPGVLEEESVPVRLVNFRDPGEMERILEAEAWRYGVGSWFGGVLTFGALKWFMTTEIFDVREVRKVERAALAQHLELAGPRYEELGLDGRLREDALAQLRIEDPADLEENLAASAGELETVAREEFLDWLEEVEEISEDLIEDGASPEPVVEPAWARFEEWLSGYETSPEEGHLLADVLAAARLAHLLADRWELRVERFGPDLRLALVSVRLEDRELPFAVYDLAGDDEPVRVVHLGSVLVQESASDDWASLTVNEIAAVIIFATGYAIGQVVGFPFPFIGLTLNTISSIWPAAPFRKEDPAAVGRGRLLAVVRLAADGAPLRSVPRFLVANAAEVEARLESELRLENRFWPEARHAGRIVSVNLGKLRRGAFVLAPGAEPAPPVRPGRGFEPERPVPGSRGPEPPPRPREERPPGREGEPRP